MIIKIKNISDEIKNLHTKSFLIDEIYTIPQTEILSWAIDPVFYEITNENFEIQDENGSMSNIAEQILYLSGMVNKFVPKPFADKTGYNFDGIGKKFLNLSSNQIHNLDFVVGPNPYGYDFQGLKITNVSNFGNIASLKILDDEFGTYSGYPNATLNQFATDWNIDFPRCSNMMPYTARLYPGMVIRAEYTNNQEVSENIYINYYTHKVTQ